MSIDQEGTGTELAIVGRQENMAVGRALTVHEIIGQVNLIQEVMRGVMKEGEHFGIIPGCGTKKTLLQPGAQKLAMTFRLAPDYDVQETQLQNGHKEYRIICTLKSIQTATVVGQGVGVCSTMESKYRFRQGARKCPECGKESIIKGKAEYGAGWLCFAKKGGCGAKWPDGAAVIENQLIDRVEHDNPADFYNCVTPDTKILTHDLRWVPAGEIKTGDPLVGVDENLSSQYARNLAIGIATVYGRRVDAIYELTLEDGRTVQCNGEHQWLVKKVGIKGTEWVATSEIEHRINNPKGRPRNWLVMSVCRPWAEDTTKESGYIAGLLDADGSVAIKQLVVLFAQQSNEVLKLMERALGERGFRFGKSPCRSETLIEGSKSKAQVYSVRILGGLFEQLRFLGTVRPPRLIGRWLVHNLTKRRLEGKGSGSGRPAKIIAVKQIGNGEIVLLGSSCKTYIAEGLVSHNTVLKIAKKRAFVDATITATSASDIFTQDIADPEEENTPERAKGPSGEPVKYTYTSTHPPQQNAPTGQPEPKKPDVKTAPKEDSKVAGLLQLCKDKLLRVAYGPLAHVWWQHGVDNGWILPTETLAEARPEAIFKGIDPSLGIDGNQQVIRDMFEQHSLCVQAMADITDAAQQEAWKQAFNKVHSAPKSEDGARPAAISPPPAQPNQKPWQCPNCKSTATKESHDLVNTFWCMKCGWQWNSTTGHAYEAHEWMRVRCPIPNKGQSKKEYDKSPSTMGQLMRLDNRRLFGLVLNCHARDGWTGRDGKHHPPSESDLKWADACDEAKKHFASKRSEKHHGGLEAQRERGGAGGIGENDGPEELDPDDPPEDDVPF